MWQLSTFPRRLTETRYTQVRRRRMYRPRCSLLEERCLLSVTLSSGGPSVPLVGSPVVWTATASGDGTTPVYQFNVTSPNGSSQMVQDFSSSNTFNWDPLLEGTYSVQVVVKNSYSSTTVDSTSASYTAQTRVVGSSAVISPTANPLVALYSAPPSSGTSMYVQFSPLSPTPSWTDTTQLPVVSGKSTNFLVAGMLPNTTYLMRDVLNNGAVSAPLAYTTGSLPTNLTFPTFTVPQAPAPATDMTQNMVLHFGVANPPNITETLATDLQGNINWYYDSVGNNFYSYGTSLVPGGTMLLLGGTFSGAGSTDTLREIDLGGNEVRQTDIYAVNAELAAMGQPSIMSFNHEAVRLPNGDTAVLALTQKIINVNGTPTTYNGDMVLVLNQNFQVSWAWNPFDWLSTSRLPTNGEGPGDWLHANSISYSPEDGNLLVSLRAQDWVIKIDYANGTGDGHVVWRLGQGGDFTINSSDPSPWFSHQHDVTYVDNSTILVFDDGNTRRLTNPNADSRGQELVLNEQTMTATLVVNADLGNYSSALGAAQLLPNGNLDFTSGDQASSSGTIGQTIEVLPNGTKTYVQQMTGPEYRSYLMSSLYGSSMTIAGSPADILNAGFEDPILGTGASAYQYDPTGTAWSFTGEAGVAGNGSGFTAGNPNAPQGTQVAFLQETGTMTQTVDFTVAGTYQLSFSAAQRANYGSSKEKVQVLIDGTVVDAFTPASTRYNSYTTAAFTVTAGSHTITFAGVDPSGSDYTALLDQLSISNAPPTGFSDSGFETPTQGTGTSAYHYDPTGTAWSFTGGAGVAGNGSGFTAGNPNAPQGTQVAFLQETGTMTQTVDFAAAGSYQVNFSAAQRANYGTSNESLQVLVDGNTVGTFTPASTSYTMLTTVAFTVTAGNHTISFIGVDPSGSDYTALLDQLSVSNAPPAGISDSGFETPVLGTGTSAYQFDPTGTAWSFTGGAGVAGNGSTFTSGNPNAPQGSQVAFLQGAGSISQTVNFATPGSYLISLAAAQRANHGTSLEEVHVLVDGKLLDTFVPAGTSYGTYTTTAFNVTAGNHTITLIGVAPTGDDYTALLDQVSLYSVSPAGFTDPSFENPSLGSGKLAYQYDPTGTAWSYSGTAGLAGNSSSFTAGNPNAPQGTQVAFLQQTGSISQSVNFAATGSYQISFSAAQRANYGTSNEQVQVLVDGTVVSTITPASTNYSIYTTAAFNVTAGSHTITFAGIDPSGSDYSAFIDASVILQVG